MKIGCVIMASGLGKRFGSNKLLQEFRGRTLMQRILDTTEDLFDKRVVVTRSEEVKELCEQQNIEVIFHSLPDRNHTVRLGVEVMNGMDACIFCPSDQPLLKKESIQKLIQSYVQKREGIHRLVFEQQEGTPILFGKEFFEELGRLPEKCGGSYLIKKYSGKVEKVNVTEETELQDVDTYEDYLRLLSYYEKEKVRY